MLNFYFDYSKQLQFQLKKYLESALKCQCVRIPAKEFWSNQVYSSFKTNNLIDYDGGFNHGHEDWFDD